MLVEIRDFVECFFIFALRLVVFPFIIRLLNVGLDNVFRRPLVRVVRLLPRVDFTIIRSLLKFIDPFNGDESKFSLFRDIIPGLLVDDERLDMFQKIERKRIAFLSLSFNLQNKIQLNKMNHNGLSFKNGLSSIVNRLIELNAFNKKITKNLFIC